MGAVTGPDIFVDKGEDGRSITERCCCGPDAQASGEEGAEEKGTVEVAFREVALVDLETGDFERGALCKGIGRGGLIETRARLLDLCGSHAEHGTLVGEKAVVRSIVD